MQAWAIFLNLLLIPTLYKGAASAGVMEAVARFPDLLGVGLAEDTGIVIKNGNECEVIGSGMVVVVDPSRLTHNNEDILAPKNPDVACKSVITRTGPGRPLLH